MILIDALYINNGGGKILLDYLMEQLNKTDLPVTYLLDERIRTDHIIPKAGDEVIIMKASFTRRKRFYKSKGNNFPKVLCFGNLPPNIKINGVVYTYFHQLLFLAIPGNIKGLSRLLYYVKTAILNSIKKNTNYWLVQSDLIKRQLAAKYEVKQEQVLVLPFYPPIGGTGLVENQRPDHTFVYVSSGEKHKNQIRLLKAFADFYDQYKIGTLTLTISDNYTEEVLAIKELQQKGYPVTNLGFIKREELAGVYKSNKFLIFPSLTESFGLGIVEAIEQGCDVIGADLPYMHAVCKPSLAFNPLDTADISDAFRRAVFEDVNKSVSLVNNRINDLVKILM